MTAEAPGVIPISDLFFDDSGPHIVSAGAVPLNPARFTPARGRQLQDLLGASIAQLGAVSGIHRRTPVTPLVPIEALLYRGRPALERAIEIRRVAREAGTLPPPDALEELLDLIQLAAEE